MDSAELDDRLWSAVKQALEQYASRMLPKEKDISLTQCAALVTYAETHGSQGVRQLVKKQRGKGCRNEAATQADKGNKPPANPTFWQTMETALNGLEPLAGEQGDADLLVRLFTSRLAAYIAYQRNTRA